MASQENSIKHLEKRGFPGGAVVESLPANAGDMGSSPGLGAEIPHASGPRKNKT